jgi:hypothetical protein
MEKSHFPALPAGHDAQPAWGFHDASGRFYFEFLRVYGPRDPVDERGATCRIVEELCFWSVTWAAAVSSRDDRVAGRWLTYAQARELRGARMTFERFASLLGMRDELESMLKIRDIAPEAPAPVGLRPIPEPALP